MKGIERLNLRASSEGTIVPVKATPGSSRDKVVGVLGDHLKTATSAVPEKGQANAAIAGILAAALGVDPRDVSLVAGATRPQKQFLIKGITADQVRAKLAESL